MGRYGVVAANGVAASSASAHVKGCLRRMSAHVKAGLRRMGKWRLGWNNRHAASV
jgi:hypothetical protein